MNVGAANSFSECAITRLLSRSTGTASRLVQDVVDAAHLRRGADQV